MTQAPARSMADDYAPCKFDACPCNPQCQRGECQHTAAPAADRAVSELKLDELIVKHGLMDEAWPSQKKLEAFAMDAIAASAPPADRAELAEKAKAAHRRRSAIKCGLLTAAECDRLDAELDSLIDALARSADAPSEPVNDAEFRARVMEVHDSMFPHVGIGAEEHEANVTKFARALLASLATQPVAATSTPCASGEGAS